MLNSKIREDFPVLERKINGKGIVYLDSACMSLKPKQVIEKLIEYYTLYPACGGRSQHKLGSEVNEKYHRSREIIAKFIGAKKPEEVVFTRNTTEGINLISRSFEFKRGDVVLTTDKEHNSNLLPWQLLKEKGVKQKIVNSNPDLTFNMNDFEQKMNEGNVKLVSMVHTSNLDGYTIPAKEVIKMAHDFGAYVLLDGAQSVPRMVVNVRKLDVDFLAFSGHKMLGPTGTGVLYGKEQLLENLNPFLVGGDTVQNSTYTSHVLLKSPEKFEAGLQNYAGMIALGEAARYIMKIKRKNIEEHEIELNKLITNELQEIEGIKIIGPEKAESRGGISSFYINKMNSHEIAIMLSELGNVFVRSGQHCVHSWFNAHNINGSVRVSLYLYNNQKDVETFIETLKNILFLK